MFLRAPTGTKFAILGAIISICSLIGLAFVFSPFFRVGLIMRIIVFGILCGLIIVGIYFPEIMKSHYDYITPDESFLGYYDCINSRDYSSAVNYTVYKFADPEIQQDCIESIKLFSQVYGDSTIWNYTIIYKENMTDDQKTEMKSIANEIENRFNHTVISYCVVEYSITDMEHWVFEYRSTPFVKIDYSWYLAYYTP